MKRRRIISLFLLLFFLAAATASAVDLADIYRDAQRSFRHGDYEQALEEWTRILTPEPTDTGTETVDLSSVYFNRGLTYKRLLRWEEAADDFSMVIGLNPNDADAFYQRGGCYNMLGLDDKAQADILRACDLEDDYCSREMLEQKREKNTKKPGMNR